MFSLPTNSPLLLLHTVATPILLCATVSFVTQNQELSTVNHTLKDELQGTSLYVVVILGIVVIGDVWFLYIEKEQHIETLEEKTTALNFQVSFFCVKQCSKVVRFLNLTAGLSLYFTGGGSGAQTGALRDRSGLRT